jgi:hypothetical protein
VLSRPVKITVRALADMMRIQGIGEPPVVIAPDPVTGEPTRDQEVADAAWQDFRDVKLVDPRGRLTGDALDTLHVLARPTIEYSAIVAGADWQDHIVVATLGSETVIAHRQDHAITLASVRDAALPETLLREIPDAAPAALNAINVRTNGRAAPTPGEARTLHYLTGQQPLGYGELFVTIRDHHGRRTRSTPIRYHDYPIGRVIVLIEAGYLSVIPATKIHLRDRLHAAHQELRSSQ